MVNRMRSRAARRLSPFELVRINSDEDCWTPENGKVIEKSYANQLKFSTDVAYGKDNCSVHITNPWLPDIQNGFGIVLIRPVDCASTVTVQCLADSVLSDRVRSVLSLSLLAMIAFAPVIFSQHRRRFNTRATRARKQSRCLVVR